MHCGIEVTSMQLTHKPITGKATLKFYLLVTWFSSTDINFVNYYFLKYEIKIYYEFFTNINGNIDAYYQTLLSEVYMFSHIPTKWIKSNYYNLR